MFKKTTSAYFLKNGCPSNSFKDDPSLIKQKHIINTKTITEVYSFDQNTYLSIDKGMGMIVIYDDDGFHEFAIHGNTRINKDVLFAIVPMDDEIECTFYKPADIKRKTTEVKTPYVLKDIEPELAIPRIIALYYVVKGPYYVFDGEVHSYYELTYVDTGKLITHIDGKEYVLTSQNLCIYGPGQFHTQSVSGEDSCSYLTIIFEADGLNDSILNRVFSCSKEIANMIEQLSNNTDSDLPFTNDLLVTILKFILIKLLQYDEEKNHPKPISQISQFAGDKMLEEIVAFIHNHIYDPLPIKQVCDAFSISRTTLQSLFKDNLKSSPKHYINELKLKRSKELIKTQKYSVLEISSILGFTSIHYFSRKFTQRFGITPSEYAKKIYEN